VAVMTLLSGFWKSSPNVQVQSSDFDWTRVFSLISSYDVIHSPDTTTRVELDDLA
jgi:hypothetical protein